MGLHTEALYGKTYGMETAKKAEGAQVRLEPDAHRRLKVIAAKWGVTMSEAVRRLCLKEDVDGE